MLMGVDILGWPGVVEHKVVCTQESLQVSIQYRRAAQKDLEGSSASG